MSTVIDLAFAVQSVQPLDADHGYTLYSALSHALPVIHAENGIAVHPLRGRQTGPRQLTLQTWSRLTLRARAEQIPELLALAGKPLRVGQASLRIGVPQVLPLTPATALRSRLVSIKNGTDPERFMKEIRRKLDHFGVSPAAIATLGKQRTLRIKHKEIIGFEVLLEGLSAEESLNIQENRTQGPPELAWSRTHMGCAVFVPLV